MPGSARCLSFRCDERLQECRVRIGRCGSQEADRVGHACLSDVACQAGVFSGVDTVIHAQATPYPTSWPHSSHH